MGDEGRVAGGPTDVLAPADPPIRRAYFVGWLAIAVAVLAAVITGVGVAQAADGEFESGATLAWVAIVLSVVAVAGGILDVIARFGRRPGVVAIVLGLLANPYLLTRLLDAAGHLTAAAATT